MAPPGNWRYWLILAGRGFGKTRSGVEWVRRMVKKVPHVNLIGATGDDARDIMIEGEALALDTPIATPTGWTTMGALSVGDMVFAADGTPTRVIATSPIWVCRPCLRIHVDGAEPIVADERHKWVTSSRAERRPWLNARHTSIKTSAEIAASIYENGRTDLVNHDVPMHNALTLPDKALPIPPYTLGAWLGDGDTRGQGTFTCHDDDAEIVSRIRADGFTVNRLGGRYDWGIRKLRVRLRAAGLIGNKKIPFDYMRASIEQRLALLRGLMDTDGYVSQRGQCSFDNTNERMVHDVRDLLLTLGFKPGAVLKKVDRRGHRPIFRVSFTRSANTPVPFALMRKADRCKPGVRPAGRLIRSVDSVDSVPTRCVQVEHESGTFLAGRDMVVTHNSGILAKTPRHERPVYLAHKRRLDWPNGARSLIFTAVEPDRLRGKQHSALWCDELAAWKYPEAWDQAKLGLRLGRDPRALITTTPRPTNAVRELVADPETVVTLGTTYDNKDNLAPAFLSRIIRRYEGTRLGRQELHAEILTDNPGALWKRGQIDADRVMVAPKMKRVVIGVDPSVTGKEDSDECGIIVAGLGVDDRGYVLADASLVASPNAWGQAIIRAYQGHAADRIVPEVNNGGELVSSVLRFVARDMGVSVLPIRPVHASRGKQTRAEPIAALYEQHRISHVGTHAGLEDQMCDWNPLESTDSPDRVDALVWALSDLFGVNPASAATAGKRIF